MLTAEDLNAIKIIVQESIKGVEGKFDGLEGKFDGLEGKFDGLERKVDGLEGKLDGLEDRLDRVENDVKVIKVDLLENNIIPRLNTIEQCYLDTSKRYTKKTEEYDAAITDIEVMKLAIKKNSDDIRELKLKQA
ncbi:MAG: hypothetical protein K6F75_04010 [Butyrivibrio sp.]|nr:hypothetical protein [Butyrivibrio sp.]